MSDIAVAASRFSAACKDFAAQAERTAAAVAPPFTPSQLTRARRIKWLLWNSDAAMSMDEDARIEELEHWCAAAAGPELGKRLFAEVFP